MFPRFSSQFGEGSLQVSHIETPPPKPRTISLYSDSEKSLEISYIEVPSYKPRINSAAFSEKSLEVSHIETPPPREPRPRLCSISSYASYNPFDEKSFEVAGNPDRSWEENWWEANSYDISPISRRTSSSSSASSLSYPFSPDSYGHVRVWDDFDGSYDEKTPPRYAHAFYNSFEEKPLPPLPRTQRSVKWRLPWSVRKPLPALPEESGAVVRRVSSRESRERCWGREGRDMWWNDTKKCWIL